jgi:hypothetical protein
MKESAIDRSALPSGSSSRRWPSCIDPACRRIRT